MRPPRNMATETPLPGLETFYSEFKAARELELLQLMSAMGIQDFLVIMKIAHKWKGIAAPYGFGELGHLAQELEVCVENSQFEKCQQLIKEISFYLSSK